jgi:hypothetical protein
MTLGKRTRDERFRRHLAYAAIRYVVLVFIYLFSRDFFFHRIVPTVLVCLTIFALMLHDFCVRDYGAGNCVPFLGPRGVSTTAPYRWRSFTGDHLQALSLAQNVVCWCFVLFAAVQGLGCGLVVCSA